jgi:speckle-type POZ protein
MSESTYTFKSREFTWNIANFSQQKLRNGPGKCIRSQYFSTGLENDLSFVLHFYPQGYVKSGVVVSEVSNGGKWASLFLQTKNFKTYTTSHRFEFSILDADGETFDSYHLHKKIPFKGNWGFTKFIRLADLENPANNLLPNDTLTICCRVEGTKSETETCNCLIEEPPTKIARRKLSEGLALITDDKFADFVFKVENEKIGAHRVILAARSPVFAAMFQHDMQETKTNETEITDVTPAAFRALLRFIYTGHCQVRNLAEELLVAANKYDIQELKQICAKELRKKLTVDNALDFLIFSDLHQANELKDGAIRFINKNAAAVMKTPPWSDFPKSYPHLFLELYCNSTENK